MPTPLLQNEFQRLSTVDLFIASDTHLPLALEFMWHPDEDARRNIPVRIEFADYRSASGVNVPFRIRRFLQNTLNLDLTITSVAVNSGITDSTFALQ